MDGGTHLLWFVTVLFSYGAVNWIYMTEYEVHFHIVAALVRSKHNGVRCLVIELQKQMIPNSKKKMVNNIVDFSGAVVTSLPWLNRQFLCPPTIV